MKALALVAALAACAALTAASAAAASVGDWVAPEWCHDLQCPEFTIKETYSDGAQLRTYEPGACAFCAHGAPSRPSVAIAAASPSPTPASPLLATTCLSLLRSPAALTLRTHAHTKKHDAQRCGRRPMCRLPG